MESSLPGRLAADDRLSPPARAAFRSPGNGIRHPLAELSRAVVQHEFEPGDLAAVALITLEEYALPEAPRLYLDAILQYALHTLRDAGEAPEPLIEAALDTLAVSSGDGAMPRMLAAYLSKAGPVCPGYRRAIASRFTQENYDLAGAQVAPESRGSWSGWPLADLFFQLNSERELAALLEASPPPGVPGERTLAYLALRTLARLPEYGPGVQLTVAVGRLMRRTAGKRDAAALHQQARVVFQERWRRTMPHGLTDYAAEVWLHLQKLGERFQPGVPVAPLPGMNRRHLETLKEREAREAERAAERNQESDLPPAEAALRRRIAAAEAALRERPSVPGWRDLAALLREAGHWEKSIEAETRAIELMPNAAGAYYWRAKARMSLQDRVRAIEDFSAAIRIWEFPDGIRKYLELEQPPHEYIDSYRTRGVAKAHLGDYRAGVADLSTALRLREDAKLRWERGWLSEKAGLREDAAADYRRAGLLYLENDARVDAARCAEGLERIGAHADARELRARLAPRQQESDLPL